MDPLTAICIATGYLLWQIVLLALASVLILKYAIATWHNAQQDRTQQEEEHTHT